MRCATEHDLEPLADLLRLKHAEDGLASINEAKLRALIEAVIAEGQCLIVEDHGRLVGSMGLTIKTWDHSDEQYMTDRWFYIHPEFRSAGHASALISLAKAAARIHPSRLSLVLSISTSQDCAKRVNFFKKHLRQIGGAFIYEPRAA